MKKLFFTFVILSLILPLPILAQDINSTTATTTATSTPPVDDDLDIGEPKVLPNSPWYWAKSLWRSVRQWATFDPIKKAEMRLQTANERLAELQELADEGTITPEHLDRILAKYEKEINKLKEHLAKVQDKTQERVERLVNQFTKQEFIRQRILQRLEEKLNAEKMEAMRERMLQRWGEILEDNDLEKIETRIKNALENTATSTEKNLYNLQVLERLKDKVSEQAGEAIIRAQSNTLKRLGEEFREMTFEERVERVQDYLENLDDATTTQQILERTRSQVPNSLPSLPVIMRRAKERMEERREEKEGRRGSSDDNSGKNDDNESNDN
ncbi:MAG: hypothetical protein A2729_02850 [Candidatus Buchananbacteria bacterium RIFCSPHIGHO2_01_FULL_39_14]|uniref:DUF5667 domain-containing protein n=2 Tax=Candidatus Buchananiibacteriota TaxID=1817903 RepID=A0A1G1YTF8_9BACT|nr:MAG: hypothetical protein A2729_02850 [Candidatus Buchananbacteria bacterium RIFCSPHIGHO2_01_FULL_39_14]OGY49435.1 MAG: hypothetical protein A3D39_02765 [Candidatus Buchananbacteria bacterium RIFCSPHIGHO2_02_FULL_39_17]OGY55642.1 MAG: hypothetical protein A2912_05540 [Candidatus Buchananbacteria bacterium RIFCSPLOWO2_01_FULL_40_23b]